MKRILDKMGAEVVYKQPEQPNPRFVRFIQNPRGIDGLKVDIRNGRFVITKKDETDIVILDSDIKDRHFLLMARDEESGKKEKFLCGFDERDWFAASVPTHTANVDQAKNNLKPQLAKASQKANGVKHRQRHKRHNKGFIRQGEWFFVPRKNAQVDEKALLHNEPLVRGGGGKPHVVEYIYRYGGELVYVTGKYPGGITENAYANLPQKEKRKHQWHPMRRNPKVLAYGKVRHDDHKTIELKCWHEVLINREVRTQNLGFLD